MCVEPGAVLTPLRPPARVDRAVDLGRPPALAHDASQSALPAARPVAAAPAASLVRLRHRREPAGDGGVHRGADDDARQLAEAAADAAASAHARGQWAV